MSTTDTERPVNTDDTGGSTADSVETKAEAGDTSREAKKGRQVSISLKSLAIGSVITVLAVAVGVLSWLYIGASNKLSAEARADEQRKHAEEAALDYAVNAAQMDYQDFEDWKVKLVNRTSPELNEKLTTAAGSIQEILTPLQWKSSARPLTAKVRSESNGIYVVDAFVSVLTKTMQAPEGLQSTATYSVTLDSNNDWQITDVGGIDAALGK